MNVYSLAYYRDDASGYESPEAGTSRGVFFEQFLPAVLRAVFAIFPDWELRIHHDDRVQATRYWPVLRALADRGRLRLIDCGPSLALCRSMLWRCMPFWDPAVDVFACRDIDSLPQPRERVMLEEFIASDKRIHVIHDSESHSGPLMGGMCAFKRRPPAPSFAEWTADFPLTEHGDDQLFLNDRFGRHDHMLIHQIREIAQYPQAETRPAPPHEGTHLGAGFDCQRAIAQYPAAELDALECTLS